MQRRFRLEHVEVIHPNTMSLMKRFGVIASVQPYHIVSDGQWLTSRLGKERLRSVLPLSYMEKKHLYLCGGSDAPIEDFDPIHGIYAAVVSAAQRDFRMSVRSAAALYTMGSAYAEFSEHMKGTLEPGKFADFAVLSEDLFNSEIEKIKDIRNEMTVIEGHIVYER